MSRSLQSTFGLDGFFRWPIVAAMRKRTTQVGSLRPNFQADGGLGLHGRHRTSDALILREPAHLRGVSHSLTVQNQATLLSSRAHEHALSASFGAAHRNVLLNTTASPDPLKPQSWRQRCHTVLFSHFGTRLA